MFSGDKRVFDDSPHVAINQVLEHRKLENTVASRICSMLLSRRTEAIMKLPEYFSYSLDYWTPSACNAVTANGSDTIVCQCDENYCDEFPPIPDKYTTDSSYIRITTDKGGQRFNVTTGTIGQNCDENGTGNTTRYNPVIITIQPNQTYQTILGFGAANTDSAAINIKKLSHSLQKKLIK